MDALGIAVIGAGMMGRTHAEAWRTVTGTELVVIADSDRERLEKAQADFEIPEGVTDWQEAVAREDVDVVSLCLPTWLHRDGTVAAVERGKHVICEKPIAMTLAEADEMIAAARDNNVKLAIGFCKRHGGSIQKMRELVQNGAIRRPCTARAVSGWEIRPKPWIMDKREGGGPIIDICCHYFDQWRYIFESDPVRVMAQGQTFSTGAPELPGKDPQIDTGTVLVEYASGDLGMISISWGLPKGVRGQSVDEILGPDGILRWGGYEKLTLIRREGEETVFVGLPGDVHHRQLSSFVDAIRTGGEPVTGGEDGRIALAVSLAALESIETKQAVEL